MRTLQEKYNGIHEGNLSKDQFLRDVRMSQPSLVTQYNGYDDAVQILKNRGMIRECFTEYSDDALTDMIVNLSRYEGNEKEIKQVKQELKNRKNIGTEKRKNTVYKPSSHMEGKDAISEVRLTKNSLTDYRFKPTNELDQYPYEQILRGIRVELEGMSVKDTPTPEEYQKALVKVTKNLQKDSIFYTNQLAGIKAGKKRTDLPIDVDVKSLFKSGGPTGAKAEGNKDLANAMTKAQLKEGFKNLIRRVLSENKEEEVYEMYGEDKANSNYKSELETYLEDNQIYGYTNRIHGIMTGPDKVEAVEELSGYLEDNQIYGKYGKDIENIYLDYKNRLDEEVDERSGLHVYPRTQEDRQKLGQVIDDSGLYAEYDVREGCYFFPEEEDLYDGLEKEIDELLNLNDINARIEGVWNEDKKNNQPDEDDEDVWDKDEQQPVQGNLDYLFDDDDEVDWNDYSTELYETVKLKDII